MPEEDLFTVAIALENDPHTHTQAIACYQKLIEMNPRHTAAHINVGTLYYNRKDYASAEKHYRLAIAADSQYALAYFNLGNTLDEIGKHEDAAVFYRACLQLDSSHKDSHYNLAISYEKRNRPGTALRHWRAYSKMDITSSWSIHSKNRIAEIIKNSGLKIISRRKRPRATKRRAKLYTL